MQKKIIKVFQVKKNNAILKKNKLFLVSMINLIYVKKENISIAGNLMLER